jgi:phosphate transport system substrate-binding protein
VLRLIGVALSVLFVAAVGLAQQQDAARQSFRISGSKTLQPVVEDWVAELKPGLEGINIVVDGGGTDTGFADFFAGRSQIAMAARQITEAELKTAAAKGIQLQEVVVARAGISVLKHKKNPIRELDLAALRAIFSGSVTRWKQVGGPDEPITVLLRNPSSHTAEFFRSVVVAPSSLTSAGIVVGTQEEVVREITARPFAIGFADFDRVLHNLDEVEVLRVRVPDAPPKLVFVRNLYFYVVTPVPPALQALLDVIKGPRGVEIATLHSYFGPNDPL